MANGLIFRIILGILFVLVIGTRRVYERRSAGVAQGGALARPGERVAFGRFVHQVARGGAQLFKIDLPFAEGFGEKGPAGPGGGQR